MDEAQAKALREPFPESAIGKLPKGGTELDYVGHAATTDRLLKVDPTWTWEPLALDAAGLPALDSKGNLWIRLTVAGVTRVGVGDGKSAKECIGDAIRNAAMRFGVALDLWTKQDLDGSVPKNARTPKDVTSLPEAPPEAPVTRTMQRASASGDGNLLSDAQLKKVNIMLREQGFTDREKALARLSELVGRAVDTSKSLTKVEAHRVIEDLEQVAEQLRVDAQAGAA